MKYLFFDTPLTYYWNGSTQFEIRDSINRCVIRFEPTKGDLVYRKQMTEFVPLICKLLNAYFESGAVTDSESIADVLKKIDPPNFDPPQFDPIKEPVTNGTPKRMGRPKGSKNIPK